MVIEMSDRYAIVEAGVVVNLAFSESALEPNWYPTDDAQIGWSFDGTTFSPPPEPIKTPEQVYDEVVAGTQARLDAFAQTRGYDGILSCATYSASTVEKFAAEGQYAVEARDETWSALYAMLAEVEAGTRPLPGGYSDVEPELPPLAWPSP